MQELCHNCPTDEGWGLPSDHVSPADLTLSSHLLQSIITSLLEGRDINMGVERCVLEEAPKPEAFRSDLRMLQNDGADALVVGEDGTYNISSDASGTYGNRNNGTTLQFLRKKFNSIRSASPSRISHSPVSPLSFDQSDWSSDAPASCGFHGLPSKITPHYDCTSLSTYCPILTSSSSFSSYSSSSSSAASQARPTLEDDDQSIGLPDDEGRRALSISGVPYPYHESRLGMANLRTGMKQANAIQKAIHASDVKLSGVHRRLPALELAMAPLRIDSNDARHLHDFIDQTIRPAMAVLQGFDTLRKLASTIDKGPNHSNMLSSPSGFETYMKQVARLETVVGFLQLNSTRVVELLRDAVEVLGHNKVVDQLTFFSLNEILEAMCPNQKQLSTGESLVQKAMEHLEAEFSRILSQEGITNLHIDRTEGNGRASVSAQRDTDKDEAEKPSALSSCSINSMPAPCLVVLKQIAEKMSAQGKFQNCLSLYEKARSEALRRSLRTLGTKSCKYLRHSTPEAVNKLDWETLEEDIAMWMPQIEAVVKLLRSERKLMEDIFINIDVAASQKTIEELKEESFCTIVMKVALLHWVNFGRAVARSMEEPQKLFKLLDMFECVESLREVLTEEVLEGQSARTKQARKQVADLQRDIARGAGKVFRAFSSQVEAERDREATPQDGGVLKVCSYVVNYLKCLLDDNYRHLVSRVIDGERSPTRSDASSGLPQLAAAVLRIMQALERNVESKARGLQDIDSALGQLFLMNNHWYIYIRCKNSLIADLLGTQWLKRHRQRAEKCALRYRREAWGALLARLTQDGLPNSAGSGVIRERIADFEARFAALYECHRGWSVPDAFLRQQVGRAVVEASIPALRWFYREYEPLLSKGEARYPPERVRQLLGGLFELPDEHPSPGRAASLRH